MFEFFRRRQLNGPDDGFLEFVRSELSRRSVSDPSTLGDGTYRTVAVIGPGFVGKRSYVRMLYERLGEADKTPLVLALPAAARDNADEDLGLHLFFDAAFDAGLPTVRVATVPGAVFHDAARSELLARADAVIFLADAQPARIDANVESYENLVSRWRSLPLVLGRTKVDLPGARSVDGLAGSSVIDVNPLTGSGVVELFKAAVRAMLSAKPD